MVGLNLRRFFHEGGPIPAITLSKAHVDMYGLAAAIIIGEIRRRPVVESAVCQIGESGRVWHRVSKDHILQTYGRAVEPLESHLRSMEEDGLLMVMNDDTWGVWMSLDERLIGESEESWGIKRNLRAEEKRVSGV